MDFGLSVRMFYICVVLAVCLQFFIFRVVVFTKGSTVFLRRVVVYLVALLDASII